MKIVLHITEQPKKIQDSGYAYGLALDKYKNIFEFYVEKDDFNKLIRVKNCITNTEMKVDDIILRGLKDENRYKKN